MGLVECAPPRFSRRSGTCEIGAAVVWAGGAGKIAKCGTWARPGSRARPDQIEAAGGGVWCDRMGKFCGPAASGVVSGRSRLMRRSHPDAPSAPYTRTAEKARLKREKQWQERLRFLRRVCPDVPPRRGVINALGGGKNENRMGKAGSCAGSARMRRPRRTAGGRKRAEKK